jgi:hypothetical protein
MRVEDVEAAASVHEDLREPGVPDDGVDHQRVLARVGDAVWVVFPAECDGILRPIEEGRRRPLRGENLVPLLLALAGRHVDGWPPKDEEHIFDGREAARVAIASVFLGLFLLRGGTAIELLEHIALLMGVIHWGLVVRTWLFQHVVEHPRASRGRSRAPSSRVNTKGLGVAAVAPLLARLAARLLPLLAPLVVAVGLLGLAALRGRVLRALALLAVADRPHGLFSGSEAGGDVEQLIGVRRRGASQLPHEIPARGALEEGVHDLGLRHAGELSAALGEAPYEVPQ